MATPPIRVFGTPGDPIKLDLFQNLKAIHWPGNDFLVITARQDETFVAGPDLDYWVWSDSFGAASLEDNLIADFDTGDPRGGTFHFPTNYGSDIEAANDTMDAFAPTSEGPHMHLEGRTEVFGIPNPSGPNSVGMNIEITGASVPIFKDPTLTTRSFMISGADPNLGTSFPASVPPTPIAWGDVLTLKRDFRNWRSDVVYDGHSSPTFVDNAQSIALLVLKGYTEPITLTFTMTGTIAEGGSTGSVEFTLGAFVMRGLKSFTLPVASPPVFTFQSGTVSFGLKNSEIPASFTESSPVKDFKKSTTGVVALGGMTTLVTKTGVLVVNPLTRKVTSLVIT